MQNLLPTLWVRLSWILWEEKQSSSYHWGFKVRHNWGVPGGRHHWVNGVLLLLRAVHLLYEDWRAILGLLLGTLIVHTGVHVAEAVFAKKRIYGFNSSLKKKGWREKENETGGESRAKTDACNSRSFLHYIIIIIPVLKSITQKREIIEEELMEKTTKTKTVYQKKKKKSLPDSLVCQVKNENGCIR